MSCSSSWRRRVSATRSSMELSCVNPPPGFTHEDGLIDLAVQLRVASPPEIAVLGSASRSSTPPRPRATRSTTRWLITVVRRSDVEEMGTVLPPQAVTRTAARPLRASPPRLAVPHPPVRPWSTSGAAHGSGGQRPRCSGFRPARRCATPEPGPQARRPHTSGGAEQVCRPQAQGTSVHVAHLAARLREEGRLPVRAVVRRSTVTAGCEPGFRGLRGELPQESPGRSPCRGTAPRSRSSRSRT
jgi:hypothetical protein